MKTFILSIFTMIFALLLSVEIAHAADDPPDVETLMTPEDYQASGLEKLTDEERAHLSEWVERYREGAVKGPVVQKPPSQMSEEELAQEEEFEIIAKVIPSFRGWGNKTIFKLDNGQVWQVRMSGRSMRYTGSESEVVISKNMLGGYVLEHVATGRAVPVKRVD